MQLLLSAWMKNLTGITGARLAPLPDTITGRLLDLVLGPHFESCSVPGLPSGMAWQAARAVFVVDLQQVLGSQVMQETGRLLIVGGLPALRCDKPLGPTAGYGKPYIRWCGRVEGP